LRFCFDETNKPLNKQSSKRRSWRPLRRAWLNHQYYRALVAPAFAGREPRDLLLSLPPCANPADLPLRTFSLLRA
jgi:hypothetical protein